MQRRSQENDSEDMTNDQTFDSESTFSDAVSPSAWKEFDGSPLDDKGNVEMGLTGDVDADAYSDTDAMLSDNGKEVTRSAEEENLLVEIRSFAINLGKGMATSGQSAIEYARTTNPNTVVSIACLMVVALLFIISASGEADEEGIKQGLESPTRPIHMQNGVVDALKSDLFDITSPFVAPLESQMSPYSDLGHDCSEKYFKCEYYWAGDTNDAKSVLNTRYCNFYVCKGMTARVSVYPQTCSGDNRVGIVKMDHDIYYSYPLAYACTSTGCGECSSAQLTTSSGMTLGFLQGCNKGESCYGQIEVSIFNSLAPEAKMKLPGTLTDKFAHQYMEGSPCPKFRGGSGNQGSFMTEVSDFAVDWKLPSSGGFKASPVIDADGTVFIGSNDKVMYAIDSDGKVKWRYRTEGKISATAALSREGVVFVASEDAFVYALSARKGSLEWEYQTGDKVYSSPVLGADGSLYFGCNDGSLYAMSSKGEKRWTFSTAIYESVKGTKAKVTIVGDGAIISSPALSPIDGTIYFGCENGYFYAVSVTGKLVFYYKTGQSIYSSPVVSSDGPDSFSVYFGSDDGYFYALSSTGALKFRFKADGPVRSSPTIGSDGNIYISCERSHGAASIGDSTDGYLYALSPSGSQLWKTPLPGGTGASPILSQDEMIYIGTDEKMMYAISAETGMVKNRILLDGKVSSSSAIDRNGTMYVSTWDHGGVSDKSSLYAFRTQTRSDKSSPTEKAIAAAPAAAAPSWYCSESLQGGKADATCESSVGKCAPGIQFIGRGVNIAYDLADPFFLQERVFDFTDFKSSAIILGKNYSMPSKNAVTVRSKPQVSHSDWASGHYSGLVDFTSKRADAMKLVDIHKNYPAPKLSLSTVLTTLVNATAVQSDIASEASYAAIDGKHLLVTSSVYSVASYNMNPTVSSTKGRICGKSFIQRVAELPTVYDPNEYLQFIEDFGTHVIVGATVGGFVRTMSTLSSCTASRKYGNVDVAYEQYKAAVKQFTTNSTANSVTFEDEKILRMTQNVCGGKTAAYKNKDESSSSWKGWKGTVMQDKGKGCLLTVDLVPVWAVLPFHRGVVQGHLSAAVIDYLKAEIVNSELNAKATTPACT